VREGGPRRCACKRVKRRDIFYIYGYLPLLCSRAGGLRQRANRRPSFPSSSPRTLSLSLSVSLLRYALSRSYRRSLKYLRFRRGESSAQDAQPAAGPCVISGAIPYSVPTMICSRLAPRSRWISFIGVRVCPTSIYRCGVPCTEYSQHHKSPADSLVVVRHFALS